VSPVRRGSVRPQGWSEGEDFPLILMNKKMHNFLFSSKKVLDFRKKWYKMEISGKKW
jgi:hypothetical protein